MRMLRIQNLLIPGDVTSRFLGLLDKGAGIMPNKNRIFFNKAQDLDEPKEGHGEIQSGISKFANDGCNAFKAIMKKTKGDDTLGPVLSAHLSILLHRSLSKEERLNTCVLGYGGAIGLSSSCLYGGDSYTSQEYKLKRGVTGSRFTI